MTGPEKTLGYINADTSVTGKVRAWGPASWLKGGALVSCYMEPWAARRLAIQLLEAAESLDGGGKP